MEPIAEDDSRMGTILLHPFIKCVSFLNFGYAVHPTEPLHLAHSEFVPVRDNYKIRVLHLLPEDLEGLKSDKNTFNRSSVVHTSFSKRQSLRNSLTEEYWFTRWNKPLQSGNRCSCSFRRSQRYSKIFAHDPVITFPPKLQNSNLLETPPTQIRNVDTFVERLLEETFLEAYQEVFILNKTRLNVKEDQKEQKTEETQAYDNFAFVQSPDEVDHVIKRRKTKTCPHKTKTKKPFLFLLHGIGNTADVWWNIIESMLKQGYEIAAPDMLGHGYSSAPNKRSAYKFSKLLEHTLAVFDYYAQMDESRRFIVIGHSFGCSFATAIARYRSPQVVQLVLISGGGPTALSPPEIGSEISVFSHLQVLISPLLFCGMKRSLFYATRGKHFRRCCDADDSIPRYVLDYIDREQNWPEGDAAFHRRILIPTLLVHGLKDTNVTLVQECEMERTIPRAFLELIPTAGHMSLLETPEQLTHMILCFIEWWAR